MSTRTTILDKKNLYYDGTPYAKMYYKGELVKEFEVPAGDYAGLCFTALEDFSSVGVQYMNGGAPQILTNL